jgi:hypothetical protein
VGHDAEYIANYLNQVDRDFRQLRERTEFDDAAMLAVADLPAGNFSSGSTWASRPGALPNQPSQIEIPSEHRAAREPGGNRATVSVLRRH